MDHEPNSATGGGTADQPQPTPEALCPEALTGLTVTKPKTAAAGATAVAVSLKHVFGVAGFRRGVRALTTLNQAQGVDCPSCAWPDPDVHRAAAEFCENGAKAVAWEADTRRLTAEFFRTHSIDELAKQSDYWHGQQGRLTEPMVLRPGSRHYEPIGWDDAFQLIADELNALASPDEAVFYTSGRTSNEAAFLYQLFVRQFGTNNLPDCSNMCHESSGSGARPDHRHRQGHGEARRLREVATDPDPRPEPRHEPPADAHRAASGQAGRGDDRRRQPAQGGGAARVQEPAGGARLARRRHPAHRPLPSGAHRRRPGAPQGRDEVAARSAARIDRAFIAENTDGFEAFAATFDEASWDAITEQSGITREADRAACRVGRRRTTVSSPAGRWG